MLLGRFKMHLVGVQEVEVVVPTKIMEALALQGKGTQEVILVAHIILIHLVGGAVRVN